MEVFDFGIIIGIAAGIIVLVALLLRKQKHTEDRFDERQIIVRSNAYRLGFFTLMFAILINVCLKLAGVVLWEEPFGEFLALFASLWVFSFVAVRGDAFATVAQNIKQLIILYAAVGLSQFTIAIQNFDRMILDGVIQLRALSVITSVTFFAQALLVFFHERSKAKEFASEEEE